MSKFDEDAFRKEVYSLITKLASKADAIDVPEKNCDCPPRQPTRRSPFGEPCEHLKKCEHDTPIDRWALMVAGGNPGYWITLEDWYREINGLPHEREDIWFSPPIPSEPDRQTIPGSAARAETYAKRFRSGNSLWHPNDITMSEVDSISTRIKTLPNGRIESLGIYWMGDDEYDDC